jgi:VWFA-related protein
VVLHAEVRVVEVPVVVRDGQRRAVGGLKKDDFEVFDDGKRQKITAYSIQAAAAGPDAKAESRARFIALCFDDLHTLPAGLKLAKDAAVQFVTTSLAPGDRVAVMTTSRSTKSVFTGDVQVLAEQIAKVTTAPQAFVDGRLMCANILPEEAYQIANHLDPGDVVLRKKVAECSACTDPRSPCHDGVITTAADAIWRQVRAGTANTLGLVDSLVGGMEKLPGRRMILLTSAGFLTGTLETEVDRVMAKAVRAEVVINSLDPRGVSDVAPSDTQGMAELASGTGGAFFHNRNDLDEGYRELGMVPETIYVLGFAPSDAADGHFHKLRVQLAGGKKYSVQARRGYVAALPESGPTISKLDSEATASDTVADLPISFRWEQWDGPPGITMIAQIDVGRMNFKPFQDRHTQRLSIVAVILDGHGGVVEGKRSDLELSFRDATFARLKEAGLPVALTIKVPPGSYSVRAVAQDAMESKLAAATAEVQVK